MSEIKNSTTCTHTRTQDGEARCYSHPVCVPPYTDPVPAAHGNIEITETCLGCGATRDFNVNGRHEEHGTWVAARPHFVGVDGHPDVGWHAYFAGTRVLRTATVVRRNGRWYESWCRPGDIPELARMRLGISATGLVAS